jgi:uncharacterized membrane protein YhhN
MNLERVPTGLTLAALVCAVGAILAAYRPRGRLAFYALKPLTTVLILCIVVMSASGAEDTYAVLIAVGLLFSLAGDVLLMLPPRYFEAGIGCFSVTHVLYFLAFTSSAGVVVANPATLVLGTLAVLLAASIWRGVKPGLRIPVLVYTFLITAMASQAVGAAREVRSASALIAGAGAILFFVSDAVLATDHFRSPFVAARAIVLSAYWLGQWLIAASTAI